MAQGLDIKAFTTGVVRSWWQWALVAIIIGSASIGILGLLWSFWNYLQRTTEVCF
jgi:hypothetical protein